MFYDSWVHWRDVLLPLGREAPASSDDTVPMLTYSLAIVGRLMDRPIDAAVAGVRLLTGEGPVVATPVADADPATQAVVVDALCGRGPLEEALPDEDPELVHRLGVLARIFNG
jgi:hypothetical protein